jgi:hypothetical protein
MSTALEIWRCDEDHIGSVEWCRGVYESPEVALLEFGLVERCEVLSIGTTGKLPVVTLSNPDDVFDVEFPAYEGWEVWCAETAKDILRVTFKKP